MPPNPSSLLSQFERLPLPPTAGAAESFSVGAVDVGGIGGRIGRASSGRPCLLLSTGISSDANRYNIELDLVGVEHQVRCVFFDASEARVGEGVFSVLRCKSDERATQVYFVDVCDSLLRMIGAEPTPARITEAIQGLVRLFRALSEPPKRTVQGLWGEVFVLENASTPAILLPAWHADPADEFDFSLGPERLEVKTTSGLPRTHVVGSNQVRPGLGIRVVVASARVASMAGGVSLGALIGRLKGRLQGDSEAALSVDQQVAACLGRTMPAALQAAFDYEAARASLKFFDAASIPAPTGIPPEVSELRFRVDLTGVGEMDHDRALQHSLAAAAQGRGAS